MPCIQFKLVKFTDERCPLTTDY